MADTKQATRFFIDTEFIEAGPYLPITLLSIGIVCDDGRELYLEAEADVSHASEWVRVNVFPYLTGPKLKLDAIAARIRSFIGLNTDIEFWGYFADYDWVVFCQIFGSMIDLPNGWPMYCRDIKQLCDSMGSPKLPEQSSTEHNALHDARWNKMAFDWLASRSGPDRTTPERKETCMHGTPISVNCGNCEAGDTWPIPKAGPDRGQQDAPDERKAYAKMRTAFNCLMLEVEPAIVRDMLATFEEYVVAAKATREGQAPKGDRIKVEREPGCKCEYAIWTNAKGCPLHGHGNLGVREIV